jgi:hypothetical protein
LDKIYLKVAKLFVREATTKHAIRSLLAPESICSINVPDTCKYQMVLKPSQSKKQDTKVEKLGIGEYEKMCLWSAGTLLGS